MRILSGDDVRRALPMAEAIEAMTQAYTALSEGRAEAPLRTQLSVPELQAVNLIMPASVATGPERSAAVKIVGVYPENARLGLPVIHAAVLVIDAQTGQPMALLEGSTLTAIRTGAGSGAATDLLARHDSRIAAIFGAGVQARTQLEALCTVRTIERAWVYAPHKDRVDLFIAKMRGRGPIPEDLRPASSPAEALREADVVAAATDSVLPVFEDADVRPGTHINGIGSFTPAMQEIPAETVQRALIVVDSVEAAMEEAGDLLQPLAQRLITEEQIRLELGEIASGKKPGRSSPDEITFFKSVGVAVQDVMAAQRALANADRLGLGTSVPW